MITLEGDQLVIRFPEVHEDAVLTISFQRTLRLPDDGVDYPLPPGLGRFPLRHLDDYADKLPKSWRRRGGVIIPMHQSEALWIHFSSPGWRRQAYPFAVKVAAGKINAVTGKRWSKALHREPQDYLVVPKQPWLDGFCVAKGVIRQLVAMPLGEGFTAEEQLTEKAEWGGSSCSSTPSVPSSGGRSRSWLSALRPWSGALYATSGSRRAGACARRSTRTIGTSRTGTSSGARAAS